jgi:hypothetical protein
MPRPNDLSKSSPPGPKWHDHCRRRDKPVDLAGRRLVPGIERQLRQEVEPRH